MSMALDELAERIRSLLPPHLVWSEKRMFGGIAFMTRGNMLVCPMKNGGLLVRVGKDGMAEALTHSGARPMEMAGRTMGGFVEVAGDAIEDDEDLSRWLKVALTFVMALPPK